MMSLSVAQNKYRSNMHKENSTKIKNIERYKKLLAAHYAKLGLKKKNWSTTQLICPITLVLLQI
jgi:hypothetical protein